MSKKEKMIKICMDYSVPDDFNVVINKPYIPWIPEDWNGILVLAESQNMSKNNIHYVNEIKKWSDKKKVCRLYNSGIEGELGIAPWDDGSLKLAIEAAFKENADKAAVSNSVMWSQVSGTNANITPEKNLILKSTDLWSLLLPVLQPKKIITAGNLAHQVISKTNTTINHIRLRLPSKTAMSRISGMFKIKDLLTRYPEVEDSIKKHPEWKKKYPLNKIFFACHALSLYGDEVDK